MRTRLWILLFIGALACNSGGGGVTAEDTGMQPTDTAQDSAAPDLTYVDSTIDLVPEAGPDTPPQDSGQDLPPLPECEPGEGCFLDPCQDNDQCLSGYCVEHMGEGVCTKTCHEDCPAGWACRQLAGTDPDVIFICVSEHANLCKPCAGSADCKAPGGADDVCMDYGVEGSFCGGACDPAAPDCPWGFTCVEAPTVDGVMMHQCLADAGVCPCTQRSIKLSLWTPCESENDLGTCSGKRICAEEGLSDCDATLAAEETCNGLDDDCDGQADEPQDVGGDLVNLCNDDNPCTQDVCGGEAGCSYVDLTEGECLDGDACTIGDHCEEGVCVGLPLACDDGNPCTDDGCNGLGGCTNEPNHEACDDGDPCTVADTCAEGACVGFPVSCECLGDADCQDLEDGDQCNGTLFCDTSVIPYQCKTAPDTVVSCDNLGDPPGGICQQATCDPDTGQCGFEPVFEDFACDDGDPCTVGDVCEDGACKAGVPALCGDDDPCTDDSCDPDQGCIHMPNTADCSDGDICTVGDFCSGGVCQAGVPTSCEDGNPCTADSCDPLLGCKHILADNQPCTDDDACTIGDTCQMGACVPGNALVCDDNNPCTTDSCDPAAGCVFAPSDGQCDDGNMCTVGDHCEGGKCIFTGGLTCQDDDPCTTDNCDPLTGCVYIMNQAPCDDGDVCTTADHCHLGGCIGGPLLQCDDDNVCTDDSCDPDTGCVNAPNTDPCDDDNECTTDDTCLAGLCLGGPPPICDDANPCTDNSCNPLTGCQYLLNTDPCDDDDECTTNDTCQNGDCAGTVSIQCQDDNPCTDDSCDPDEGCQFDPNTDPCDDEDACTTDDTCSGGACVGGPALPCDDGDECTADSCDPDSGCVFTPIVPCCGNGITEPPEFCDDGNDIDDDGCPNSCSSPTGCSDQAEFHFEVTPGLWACVNNALIMSYDENFSMCAEGWTPATYNLVQGLQMPTLQEHQTFRNWYEQVMPNNGNYIRTGQKRRGGCTLTEHGELYVPNPDWGYEPDHGWHDLFLGGPSCNKSTGSANSVQGHPLAGVICVVGEYTPPQP